MSPSRVVPPNIRARCHRKNREIAIAPRRRQKHARPRRRGAFERIDASARSRATLARRFAALGARAGLDAREDSREGRETCAFEATR